MGGVLVVAHVIAAHLPLGVQQPGLEFIGVSLKLEELVGVLEALLPKRGQFLQLLPLPADVVHALLNLWGAKVLGLDHLIAGGQHLVQVGAAGAELVLEGAVFALEHQHARQVLAIIQGGENVLLLSNPALQLRHLPQEVPEEARLVQASSSLGRQGAELLVAQIQVLHPVPDHLRITRLVAWGGS